MQRGFAASTSAGRRSPRQSSAGSRPSPRRPDSAYVRFRRKSRGAPAEESLGRSQSASGPASRMPCDLFLHVCSSYPNQLSRTFVEANHRMLWIGFFGVEIENVLHTRDISTVHVRNAPHVPAPRLQVVLGQTSTHRLI